MSPVASGNHRLDHHDTPTWTRGITPDYRGPEGVWIVANLTAGPA